MKGNREHSPVLIEPKSRSSSCPLLNIQFELFPTNTNLSDYRFYLNIQPIYIIYDAVSYRKRLFSTLIYQYRKHLIVLLNVLNQMQIQIHLYQLSKFYSRNKISKQKKICFSLE